MNIQHVVLFCFSSALCGGNTGLVSAKLNIYTGAEGGTGSISCHLTLTGNTKFFCRDECKGEDTLIRTDDVTAQNGRYSIAYSNGSSGTGILTVTITRVSKSDAGRYRCGLTNTLGSYSYQDFGLRVLDVGLLDVWSGFRYTNTEGEKVTHGCVDSAYRSWKFFCKDECKKQDDVLIETDGNRTQSGRYSIEYTEGSPELRVTISQVTKLDTGRYRCGYGRAFSPEVYALFPIIVIDAPTTSSPNRSPPRPLVSVPSASTPITSSSAGSFTPSPVFPATTNQLTMYIFPLVVCVLLVVVLSALVMLLLYKQQTMMTSNSINMECVTYENQSPASTYQDSIYQSLDPASRDHNQIYSIQHETV